MSSARRRHLIVDGHSVIHAWPDLRDWHGRNARAVRDELVARLTTLHDAADEGVVVVFDGKGPRPAESERVRPLDVQVVYSGRGQTADAVIERLVVHYAATHELTVVTEDGAVRLAVTAGGAWWMGAEALLARYRDVVRAQGREIAFRRGRGAGYRLGEAWRSDGKDSKR